MVRRRKKRKNNSLWKELKKIKKDFMIVPVHHGIENINYKHELVATIYSIVDGFLCDIALTTGANLEEIEEYADILDFVALEVSWFKMSAIEIEISEDRIDMISKLDQITIRFSDGEVCISGGVADDWQLAFNSWNDAVHFATTILSPIPRPSGSTAIDIL